MKNKHLSFDDRLEIENGLKNRKTFKEIGNIVGKDCTTISKEIRNHLQLVVNLIIVLIVKIVNSDKKE